MVYITLVVDVEISLELNAVRQEEAQLRSWLAVSQLAVSRVYTIQLAASQPCALVDGMRFVNE